MPKTAVREVFVTVAVAILCANLILWLYGAVREIVDSRSTSNATQEQFEKSY